MRHLNLLAIATTVSLLVSSFGASAQEKKPCKPTLRFKLDGFSLEDLKALRAQLEQEIAKREKKVVVERVEVRKPATQQPAKAPEAGTAAAKKAEAEKKKDDGWLSDMWKALGTDKEKKNTAEAIADAALSNEEVRKGLREALSKGVRSAISTLGKKDGFFKFEDVKILLPDKYANVDKTMRFLGQGKHIDELVLTMNRAAEKAVPEVVDIFAKSISELTIADAKRILKGKNDEATQYFKKTSTGDLTNKIKPIVTEMTNKAGASKAYKDLLKKLGPMQAVLKDVTFDLDSHVTAKALDGLFLMIAREEKSIRENPAARTTDILRKVFGLK